MGRPFEHEARLKELLVRQTELNAALDLDKGERQICPEAGVGGSAEVDGMPERTREPPGRTRGPINEMAGRGVTDPTASN